MTTALNSHKSKKSKNLEFPKPVIVMEKPERNKEQHQGVQEAELEVSQHAVQEASNDHLIQGPPRGHEGLKLDEGRDEEHFWYVP
jgi:hypothetical protein